MRKPEEKQGTQKEQTERSKKMKNYTYKKEKRAPPERAAES